MRLSLIISTYNWPEALNKVLSSVTFQSVLPCQVLIADDGSGKETEKLIHSWKKKFPCPMEHIWHEDRGFRLALIRNKAIQKAKGAYIVQVDGDTILQKNFIADHLKYADPQCFAVASRILLSPALTKKILHNNIPIRNLKPFHLKNLLPIAFLNRSAPIIYNLPEKAKHRIRGCNMGFWKKHLLAINGYNNSIEGWGREDTEIVVRLLNMGVKFKRIVCAALQYHLYHVERKPQDIDQKDEQIDHLIKTKSSVCLNGIEQIKG